MPPWTGVRPCEIAAVLKLQLPCVYDLKPSGQPIAVTQSKHCMLLCHGKTSAKAASRAPQCTRAR